MADEQSEPAGPHCDEGPEATCFDLLEPALWPVTFAALAVFFFRFGLLLSFTASAKVDQSGWLLFGSPLAYASIGLWLVACLTVMTGLFVRLLGHGRRFRRTAAQLLMAGWLSFLLAIVLGCVALRSFRYPQ